MDSGADISLFPRHVGETLLVLRIEYGKEHVLLGIGGEPVKSFIHDGIEMKLGEQIFRTRVAFAESDTVPHILGRMDVSDRFNVVFDHNRRQTCFED